METLWIKEMKKGETWAGDDCVEEEAMARNGGEDRGIGENKVLVENWLLNRPFLLQL